MNQKKSEVPQLWGVPMWIICLLLLILQTVSVILCLRVSRLIGQQTGEIYISGTAVVISEISKILISLAVLWYNHGKGLPNYLYKCLIIEYRGLLEISVPAILYTIQNNLLYFALSRLSGPVYQVTYQLKILATALLSILILNAHISRRKWIALLILTVGVVLIQKPSSSSTTVTDMEVSSQLSGVIAVLCACMTSGLAGVYLEKLAKKGSHCIWIQNIQLGLYGSIVGSIFCYFNDYTTITEKGIFFGYNPYAIYSIILQGLGGIVVSLVVKYADNILKCFANAVSIVFSCILSQYLLDDFTPSISFIIGSCLVFYSTYMYIQKSESNTIVTESKLGVKLEKLK